MVLLKDFLLRARGSDTPKMNLIAQDRTL